jgi:hypothetical protein
MPPAVKPIQLFSTSTKRQLEEFRLDSNTALASQPKVWAEDLGKVVTGTSLKETIPVALPVVKYRKRSGESVRIDVQLADDITIEKDEYYADATAEAKRLQRGDHAYIKTWRDNAPAMARGRVFLRNRLIANLLKNGHTKKSLFGTNFFSDSHPVNPRDASIKHHDGASATWSNYQTSAKPLNATNLTAEKTLFKMTPGPDGEEMGLEATHIIVPTVLDDTAFNLISVQDLIVSGSLDGAGGGTMGTERNPHHRQYGRGLNSIRAPELPGIDATADWYLVSITFAAMGLVPWIIAEDPTDEFTVWDENSDFYKDSKPKQIKVESEILLEAALAFPHCIRKIKGS